MTSLDYCLNLNSTAVALLQAGRKKEAADNIKQSLRCLETLFNASRNGGASNKLGADTSSKVHPQHHSIYSVLVEGSSDNSASNMFAFYPKMINFADNSNNLGVSKVLVVLLYNLSVLSHIEIMNQDSPSPYSLMQCMELYETAMSVAHNSWTSQEADDMLLVLLALANNVGHIHSHLLNFQETRESLSLQMHLLAKSCEKNPLPLEDYEVFFEGVCVFLDGHDLHLAPAA